jgi:hypothetical protein
MLLLHPLDFSLRSRISHHALSKAPDMSRKIPKTYLALECSTDSRTLRVAYIVDLPIVKPKPIV